MRADQPTQYSLDTLCTLIAYWPSRTPLGFAAAQPRCRLSAEIHCVASSSSWPQASSGPLGHGSDSEKDRHDEAWTSWAAQLPFGEWWVTELAQKVTPSEEQTFAEVPVNDMDLDIRGGGREALGLPSPPKSSPPLPHAGASPLPHMRATAVCHRTYLHQRAATVARYQAGVVGDRRGQAAAAAAAACGAAWPDCPYPGERLRCVEVRSGYAGGVHVGHLVSFLVPAVDEHISDDDGDAGAATAGGKEGVFYNRVLHWEVEAEEVHHTRCTSQDRAPAVSHTSCGAAYAPLCQGSDEARRSQRSSSNKSSTWDYAYWWFSRPFCWSSVLADDRSLPGSSSGEGYTNPLPRSVAALVPTSLYVYGSHPAALAQYLPPGTGAISAQYTASLSAPSTTVEGSGGTFHLGGSVAFLTALHFHDCRAPRRSALVSPHDAAGQLQSWCGALQHVGGFCARLKRVEVDLDGCREEPVEGESIPDNEETRHAVDAFSTMGEAPTTSQLHADADSGVLRPKHIAPRFPASAQLLTVPLAPALTEVCINDSALCDVNMLGLLPSLRLADLSRNAHLVDVGVEGIAHSTSLRVLNLSRCVLVDAAAAPLAAIASLEELYLTGTALRDVTLRAIVAHQRHRAHGAEGGAGGSLLRVLHVDGCRWVRRPLAAFHGVVSPLPSDSPRGVGAGFWPALEDFCASSASRPHRNEPPNEGLHTSSSENSQEDNDVDDTREENHQLTAAVPPRAPTSDAEKAVTAAEPTSTPLVLASQSLTTLELHHTLLRHPLDNAAAFSRLQHLSLLQCAAAADVLPSTDHPSPSPPWWSALQHCPSLRTVCLDSCDASLIDGAALRAVAQLPSLQSLSLHHGRVLDTDIAALVQALRERGADYPFFPLQRLSLDLCPRLTHIAAIATLTSLRVLDLSDTAVQQDCIEALARCAPRHTLQVLRLAACAFVTNAGPLAALRELHRLDLSHTPLTTAAVAGLRHCPSLTHLSLKSCAGVTHVKDVLSIATLEVLNVQGAGLQEVPQRAAQDEEGGGENMARQGGGGTPRQYTSSSGSGHHHHDDGAAEGFYCDIFPDEDATLCRSRLHTLLLSRTRVCHIRRLGLLPFLMCLDLGATDVTDAELARFVCTGVRRGDSSSRLPPLVAHSLEDLCAAGALLSDGGGLSHQDHQCRRHDGPPLRLLSLQLCRHVFAVGVLGLCPRLVKLDLAFSNVTSRGLVGLHRSRSLAQLRLSGCKGVHDLRLLAALASLREVEGSGCNVHFGRLMGDHGEVSCGRGAPQGLLAKHSDLYCEVDIHTARGVALLWLVEGQRETSPPSPPPPLSPVCSALSFSVVAPLLHRVALDGCVNLRGGLAALGRLPALMVLSLCNCGGVTSESIAECGVGGGGDASNAESAPTPQSSSASPLLLFPALRCLYLSRCRNLTGTLRGLEGLPLLQRVHVVQSAITNLDAVVESLRSRVFLES